MEKRIGSLIILIEKPDRVPELNTLFHKHSAIILGRQGVPMHSRNIRIISLIVEGSTDEIGALSGQIGRLEGVKVKSVLTSYRERTDHE